jgi:hypothetical protein
MSNADGGGTNGPGGAAGRADPVGAGGAAARAVAGARTPAKKIRAATALRGAVMRIAILTTSKGIEL